MSTKTTTIHEDYATEQARIHAEYAARYHRTAAVLTDNPLVQNHLEFALVVAKAARQSEGFARSREDNADLHGEQGQKMAREARRSAKKSRQAAMEAAYDVICELADAIARAAK